MIVQRIKRYNFFWGGSGGVESVSLGDQEVVMFLFWNYDPEKVFIRGSGSSIGIIFEDHDALKVIV